MRFEALGPLRVADENGPVRLRPISRRLLSSLLVSPERPLSADALVHQLWRDKPPSNPRNSIHVHLSGLRRQLPGVIHTSGDGYLAILNGHGFDVLEFSDLVSQASRRLSEGKLRGASDLADRAARLWRGDPFFELTDVQDALSERFRLSELLVVARTTHARALTLQGRVSDSIAVLRQVLVDHPFNENLWEELILAYYLSGRQADALGAYREARLTLFDELGVEPGRRLRELEDRILLQDPTLDPSKTDRMPSNLSSPTNSFVGREHDFDMVAKLLEGNRLVTITGGPGIGKSRLALESAHTLLDRYPGGARWIRLVGATSESDLLATVGAVAEINTGGSLDDLGAALATKPCLFVLDNCEHLIDEVAALAKSCLAVSGPARLLLTSRSPTGVDGEVVWRLGTLELPESENGAVPLDNPTVSLFVDRVRDVDPSFRPDQLTADLLELCRRAAGIPLALELAAGSVSAPGIGNLTEVVSRPALPTPLSEVPHHGSLGTAVDWSLGLLREEDRQTLITATVFSGDFDLEAFGAVCLPGARIARVAETIARLVSASLMVAVRTLPGPIRYRILEPIREHGRELVDDPIGLGNRHAGWFLERAQVHAALAGGSEEAYSLQTIDVEIADFRAAMRHLIDRGRHNQAAEIATVLNGYWYARYLGWEATTWLEEILAGDLENEMRVRSLCAAGWAAYTRADYPVATVRYEAARDLAVEIGDRKGEGDAWYGLARVEMGINPEGWKPILDKAIAVYESVDDGELELIKCYAWVALDASNRGDRALAEKLYARVIDVWERRGLLRSVSMVHSDLSIAAWLDDDEDGARHHVAQAEAIARRVEWRPALYSALQQRALVEARWGSVELAASGLTEALANTPPAHANYIWMYVANALGVMIRMEDWDRAALLMATIDQTYHRNGWPPIAPRRHAHVWFRDRITEHVPIPDIPDEDLLSVVEVRDDVLAYLDTLIGQPV